MKAASKNTSNISLIMYSPKGLLVIECIPG